MPLGGQSQTLPEAIRAVLDSVIAIGSLWVCMIPAAQVAAAAA